MTDDRVAGLPDAGTIQPGDPGHIETHDRMAELMQFAAERIGIILDPPAPKPAVIGEYGHVDAHNTLLANIEQIAREAGTAVGGPPAPILTNPEGGSVVAFTSGGEGAGGPTIAYGAEIEPNDHGETVTVEYDDPLVGGEVAVSNTQPFTDYIVTVYGVNVAGRGESATTDAFQLNYNDAKGGDVVDEYTVVSDGTRWRYHKFTPAGRHTLTVVSAPKKFRVLLVGGGGEGGQGINITASNGGGAGGGGVLDDLTDLSVKDYEVEVGAGGAGGPYGNGYNGGKSTLADLVAHGGVGGGDNGQGSPSGEPTRHAGTNANAYDGGAGGGAGASPAGNAGGVGLNSDITGAPVISCGQGGQGGQYGGGDGRDGAYPGGGAGGKHRGASPKRPGKNGVVIVAYQIGTSTTRQIEQAQAEAAAREAGYATGYEVGVGDGREQRNEEIRAAAEEVKEARPTKDKK